MIVKVVPGRRDGKTDMKVLAKYITQGMGDQVKAEAGFGQLTEYMSGEESTEGKQKCIAVALNGLGNLEDAAIELYAVAAKNTRVTDPVLHLVVSWPEFERPSNEDVFWAGRRVLKSLNLQEHQSIMAIHGDTDNLHVHIEVNRVHPTTFRAQHLPWLHKTLHREARHIEIEKGWFHDNGLFVVQETADGQKFVVPNDGYVETPEIRHGKPAAKTTDGRAPTAGSEADTTVYPVDTPPTDPLPHMDHWSDEPSLITVCRETVADEVLAAIDVDPTWDAVHQVLAEHGMQLQKSGPASWRLEAMQGESGEVIRLPASKALRKLKLATLADRLGEFSPPVGPLRPAPTAEPQVASPDIETNKGRPATKRDPDKRLLRRLQRAQERTELIERYRAAKAEASTKRVELRQESQRITAWRNEQHQALRRNFDQRRAAIRANLNLSDTVKRQQYSLLAMERIQARLRIDATTKERRDALAASLPPIPQWRPWVEDLAKSGDEAAIKALRGMVYQERREANKAGRLAADPDVDLPPTNQEVDAVVAQILARRRQEDAIYPARLLQQSQAQVLLKMIEGLQWQVTNNGSIRYSKVMGDPLFTDRGNRLSFDRRHVSDEELRLTLMHAREKFGSSIVLSGTDKVFTERMVKAAAEIGLQVRNPELRTLWKQHVDRAGINKKAQDRPRNGGARR